MNGVVIEKNENIIDQDFNSLAWVLKARSKDELRRNLFGIYSTGDGKFVATDGHRLHVAEIPKFAETIPEGVWAYVHASKRKISLRQTDGLTFPSYQPLFDEFNRSEPKKNGSIHLFKDRLSEVVWQFWDLVGIRVNINYLEDALSGGEEMNIRSIEKTDQIELSYEGSDGNTKRALIMAMKGPGRIS